LSQAQLTASRRRRKLTDEEAYRRQVGHLKDDRHMGSNYSPSRLQVPLIKVEMRNANVIARNGVEQAATADKNGR
jgi:hypothetical protein